MPAAIVGSGFITTTDSRVHSSLTIDNVTFSPNFPSKAINGVFQKAEITNSKFDDLLPRAFESLRSRTFIFKGNTVQKWANESLALPAMCGQILEVAKLQLPQSCLFLKNELHLEQKLVGQSDQNPDWACALGKHILCREGKNPQIKIESCDKVKDLKDLKDRVCDSYRTCQCRKDECPISFKEVPVLEIIGEKCRPSLKAGNFSNIDNNRFSVSFFRVKIDTIEAEAFSNLNMKMLAFVESDIANIAPNAFRNVSVDYFRITDTAIDYVDEHAFKHIRVYFSALFGWFYGNYTPPPGQCHRRSRIFTAPGRFSKCPNSYRFTGSFS